MNGSFVPSSLMEILRDLFLSERSGILSLSRAGVSKRIHFDRGMIYFADSSLEDEGFLVVLARNRPLTPAEVGGVRERPGDDLALARRLHQEGGIAPDRLVASVREGIHQILTSTCRWESGEFTFLDTPPGGSEQFPTDVLLTFDYLMRGIRALADFGPVRDAMLRLDRMVLLSDAVFLPLERLALHPIHGFALSRVDGRTRIREIAALIPPADEESALRFLFGLLLLGIVRIDPPLGPGPLGVRELLTGDREHEERAGREAAVIREMAREVTRPAPWDVLGLQPGSAGDEVRRAYEARKDAFRPDRFLRKVQESFRAELKLIEGKLLEAYLAMAQSQMQSARPAGGSHGTVTLNMDTLSKRKELTKTETQEILEEQSRRAEQFYTKAREYFKSKDFYNAIQYCEQALKGNDQDARYHSLLGQSLVRNPDYRWQKRAELCLRKATEIDPWNAEYFVHLGNFYLAHNLLRKAKRSFLRAAEIMPSHQEALKALAGMKNVEA